MSIPVDLTRLAQVLGDFESGYLITVGADGSAKVVSVDPEAHGAELSLQPSQGSARNLATNPTATLVLPPVQRHGYSLIVDGTAQEHEGGITFTPAAAVLHRPGRHADGPPAPASAGDQTDCENDCRPV